MNSLMQGVLLHNELRTRLELFLDNHLHALLLSGTKGAGKAFVMENLAAHILKVPHEKLINHPGCLHIEANDGSIGIEAVRELKRSTTLKMTGSGSIRRVILVVDAQNMTIEAQNALLKLLEEPPEDTMVLLTESGEKQLRSTVYSRLQHIQMIQPAKSGVIDHFGQKTTTGTDEIERIYHLTNGQIGLMSSLLGGSPDDNLDNEIEMAKNILTSKAYARLLLADEIAKQKNSIGDLLFVMRQVSRSALLGSIKKNDYAQTKIWFRRSKLIFETEQLAGKNPNPKLLLTNLLLNL